MQTTISINTTAAFAEYAKASKETREAIERIVGKDNLMLDIKERVYDLPSACAENGTVIGDPKFTRGDDQDNALKELEEIAKALRCGTELDYSNPNQKKWFVVMIWDNSLSGFRFSVSDCGHVNAYAICGPRLCFLNKEDIKHAVEHHIELYRKVNTWVSDQNRKSKQ